MGKKEVDQLIAPNILAIQGLSFFSRLYGFWNIRQLAFLDKGFSVLSNINWIETQTELEKRFKS